MTLQIEPGEIVTIVGPNGSGKTSLLRAIIGAVKPSRGRVTVAKRQAGICAPETAYRSDAADDRGAVFAAARRCCRGRLRTRWPRRAFRTCLTHRCRDLSGGQFQRVLLARALIGRPDLLLLDEATQGLDQPGSAAFYRQIEQVRRDTGCAVLMISHELHVVMSASDRVVCLNGHVCCEGTPEVVASAPEYRALFGSGTLGALALYRHDHDHNRSPRPRPRPYPRPKTRHTEAAE